MFKSFSHIYIEEEIENHFRTLQILERFKSSEIIKIKHYKDVFNKRGQDFRIQKLSPKLILARKKDQFLYPGSDFSPNFDHPQFYYNTLALNCLYDCDYCYLQGMFSSGNIVLFVNWEDFFQSTDEFLKKQGNLYLALSYDTDLLATEGFFPATKAWIEFAKSRPELVLEIRTKSSNYQLLADIKPIPNVILAWTVSPESISKQIEKKTAPMEARIQSLKKASEDGWNVRICLDPILREPGWKEAYSDLIQKFKKTLNSEKIMDFSIGSFRMNADFLKNMQDLRQDTAVLFYPFQKKDGVVSYSASENEEMIHSIRSLLSDWIEDSKIKLSY
ncbi:spore photoproduct lyase family protein [Leptospira ilyithenensis]|uniref:DNA photolyase n=1 Tax=Leptospira ilyithenensis TaxID=2484901 RepID=A0A4R9LLP9_9LEPT|nr:DNA photolyase [Leptospira ilyithenensis]TGN06920.1 DNA photolyase [Leptospira ilyithenensis]